MHRGRNGDVFKTSVSPTIQGVATPAPSHSAERQPDATNQERQCHIGHSAEWQPDATATRQWDPVAPPSLEEIPLARWWKSLVPNRLVHRVVLTKFLDLVLVRALLLCVLRVSRPS